LDPQCEKIIGHFSSTSQLITGVEWVFSNGFTSTDPDLTYTFNYGDSVDISLVAYNYTCTDTFILSNPLHFSNLISLPPPNIITPNGDNLNDCFKLKTAQDFEDCYSLTVYNRWGKKVFKKDATHKCWDGKNQSNGKDLSEGVYYYIITIGDKSFQGTVTLMK
ncbi:MAG: gliding motility-associated C-terminal domain-containing protein, partial [Bacteroidales bacterium]